MVYYLVLIYYFQKNFKPCFFYFKDIWQHFKFVNWRIGEFVFWCHEQVNIYTYIILVGVNSFEIIVWTTNFQIPVILSRLFFSNLKYFKPVLCARFRVVSLPNQKNSSNTTTYTVWSTAKRKLERLQFSTSSSFVKIWSACSCEFKAYFWTFLALYHLLFDLETIGVN